MLKQFWRTVAAGIVQRRKTVFAGLAAAPMFLLPAHNARAAAPANTGSDGFTTASVQGSGYTLPGGNFIGVYAPVSHAATAGVHKRSLHPGHHRHNSGWHHHLLRDISLVCECLSRAHPNPGVSHSPAPETNLGAVTAAQQVTAQVGGATVDVGGGGLPYSSSPAPVQVPVSVPAAAAPISVAHPASVSAHKRAQPVVYKDNSRIWDIVDSGKISVNLGVTATLPTGGASIGKGYEGGVSYEKDLITTRFGNFGLGIGGNVAWVQGIKSQRTENYNYNVVINGHPYSGTVLVHTKSTTGFTLGSFFAAPSYTTPNGAFTLMAGPAITYGKINTSVSIDGTAPQKISGRRTIGVGAELSVSVDPLKMLNMSYAGVSLTFNASANVGKANIPDSRLKTLVGDVMLGLSLKYTF